MKLGKTRRALAGILADLVGDMFDADAPRPNREDSTKDPHRICWSAYSVSKRYVYSYDRMTDCVRWKDCLSLGDSDDPCVSVEWHLVDKRYWPERLGGPRRKRYQKREKSFEERVEKLESSVSRMKQTSDEMDRILRLDRALHPKKFSDNCSFLLTRCYLSGIIQA